MISTEVITRAVSSADPAAVTHSPGSKQGVKIAILVPCYNEATTIVQVVEGFRSALPAAAIYVYDNNSRDDTAKLAADAGAVVRVERRQGKGHVVRRMFADIDADCYILVDGDDTYDPLAAADVATMVIGEGFDFVNVARVSIAIEAYRRGHRLGNQVLTQMVRFFFGRETSDGCGRDWKNRRIYGGRSNA